MSEHTGSTVHAAYPEAQVHMIRLDVDLRSFHRWAGSRHMIGRNVFDYGYAMHCLLTEVFGHLAPKPFRFIVPGRRRAMQGVLYGYSSVSSELLVESAGRYADPLQALVLPRETIHSKQMPSHWKTGSRLGFEVLLRPVIRQARSSANPGAERDVFQREAEQLPEGGMSRTREDVYSDWLSENLVRQGGAALEECSLHSFQRIRGVRNLHGRHIEGPHAVMRGTLAVSDSIQFTALLSSGIGRHRSYGYGMLLLRPPRWM